MPEFNRFDICEAHLAIEQEWHSGGWLSERPSNVRRKEATHVQLERMGFKTGASWNGYESLTDNGKEIYLELCERYGFGPEPTDQEYRDSVQTNDELEVDDNAVVSQTDNGAFVQAWVWVRRSDVKGYEAF